jgi:hypothetical protein
MWMRNGVTVVLSVVLSVLATLMVARRNRSEAIELVRARRIELVDEKGNVRGAFKLGVWAGAEGKEVPSIVLLDDDGNVAVDLLLNPRGEGTLYFNSHSAKNFREGIISLGYLQFDDSGAAQDPSGAWGLRVENNRRSTTGMGIRNSGEPLGLSALPGGANVVK